MARVRNPDPNSFEALTSDEKAAADRAQLYQTHKVRGSLGTFYEMFPDLAPRQPPRRRQAEEGSRER